MATPYAAGLSTLVDDEAELGAAVVDFGGGSTTVGVFSGGRLIHVDAVAVGGIHITRDIARGLNVSVSDAERLKTLYGACIASPSDDREVGRRQPARRRHGPSQPSAQVGAAADHPPARRGNPRTRSRPASQFGPCRPGRPQAGDDGRGLPAHRSAGIRANGHLRVRPASGALLESRACPESGKSPSFAACVGLLVYPQMAGLEYFEPSRSVQPHAHGEGGYAARVGRWLKASF